MFSVFFFRKTPKNQEIDFFLWKEKHMLDIRKRKYIFGSEFPRTRTRIGFPGMEL
jgi:hypothetical protein